jgi:hypothetical protein
MPTAQDRTAQLQTELANCVMNNSWVWCLGEIAARCTLTAAFRDHTVCENYRPGDAGLCYTFYVNAHMAMSLARWRAAVDTAWHQNKGELGI